MTVVCRYTYDPLDRLTARAPEVQAIAQRFYKAGQLATELQGAAHRSFVRSGTQLLAQTSQSDTVLLGADQQNSVLQADDTAIAYAPYGHREDETELPGFTGEQPDPVTGHYLLGNGFRAYNPVLMRFNSPDNLSPFAGGGLNAYSYCLGDPINRVDPSGHMSWQAGLGFGLSVFGIVASFWSFGAATPLAIAGLTTGIFSGGAGVAQALTEETNPQLSSVLGWLGLGLGIASAGFGVAAVFQKVGDKVAQRFFKEGGLSGEGALSFGIKYQLSQFKKVRPRLSYLPPHIKEHIANNLPGTDAGSLAQVSSDFRSAVMAQSKARFDALKYAELPHQQWLSALDRIYFGEVDGIAPMFLKRNGILHSDIRAELIREPRVIGYYLWLFSKKLEYGPADTALLARQLHASAGGGF